ncbi:MAG TPA: outer membrane beta-barrel protein [Caulobacteraceae bacterium]|jgi:outer membrane immunogenic protein|nr:outer membrane beta-barrel protein [Caulobacteraceae bacterium]
MRRRTFGVLNTMSRKLILAAGAGAAGLILAAAAAAQPVAGPDDSTWTWSGPYAGVNIGYGWGNFDYPYFGSTDAAGTVPVTGTVRQRAHGVIGGGQVGYNFQGFGPVVLGMEADIQGADISSRNAYDGVTVASGDTTGTLESKLDYLGTVRGRVGLPLGGRLMPYVTGGWAFGGVRSSAAFACPSCGTNGAPINTAYSDSHMRSGWTAGGGVEYGLSRHMSVKAEYLYADLGHHDIFGSGDNFTYGGAGIYNAGLAERTKANIVRVGVNWRF